MGQIASCDQYHADHKRAIMAVYASSEPVLNKRHFLATTGLLATLPLRGFARPTAASASGPVLLTVSGTITHANRGAFDPALDQLMSKHKVSFDRAYTFDFSALARLPIHTIQPTLEYDARIHRLSGPRLIDVLTAVGAQLADNTTVVLRAIDGYIATPTYTDILAQDFILATHIDNHPMALGGLGPLWAVYDADRIASLQKLPLKDRFSACPWATYHIEVKPA